jgi:transcriptional regulator with PAS, ATPase and Fis domain
MQLEVKPGGEILYKVERKFIEDVLAYYKGNKTLAAKALGISTKTIYNKLRQYAREDAEVVRPTPHY